MRPHRRQTCTRPESLGPGRRGARDSVRSALARHALPELADTAVLLTSELLTNTWRHAPGPASLGLKWADKRLRASVWDTGLLPPPPTDCPELYAEGGRGLALVELCADAWGSFVMGPAQGKVVWFELMSGAPGRMAA